MRGAAEVSRTTPDARPYATFDVPVAAPISLCADYDRPGRVPRIGEI